jgi:cytochrome b561
VEIQMAQVWESASVVLALQAMTIGWRINRESQLSEKGEPTWMPVADIVNLIAILLSVLGVFVAPVLGLASGRFTARVFGLVLILTVGHVFALAGHYELFNL